MFDNKKIKTNKSIMDNAMNQVTKNITANKNAIKAPAKKEDNQISENNFDISGSTIEELNEKDITNKENTSGFIKGGPFLGEDMLEAGMEQQENNFLNDYIVVDSVPEELKRKRDLTKGADVHEELMDAKASLYSERSKSDSGRMKSIKDALNELFPANGESVLEQHLPESAQNYQIEMARIREKYAKVIQKLEEYVKNRQNPRSANGKVRLQRAENLLDIARKDAHFFASGAENTAYIKQFKATNDRMPTWGELLRVARSYTANLGDTTGGQSAQTKKFKDGNVTYFFKKDVVTYQGGVDGAVKKILKNKKTDPSVAEYDRQLKLYKNKDLYDSLRIKYRDALKTLAPGIKALYEENYYKFTEDNFYELVDAIFSYNFDAEDYKTALTSLDNINKCIGKDEALTKLININKPYVKNDAIDENDLDDSLRVQKNITEFKNKYSSAILMSSFAESHNLKGGSSLDMRNVATSRMADLLGIGDLVMKSRPATINKADGTMETGVLMEDVGGISFKELIMKNSRRRGNIRFTRKAGMDMAKLMLFDILCCQSDRHAGNIHVHYTEQYGAIYITKIVGIDNDLAFSEFEEGKTQKLPSMKNPTIFNRDHDCIFEYMDKNLYNNLMALDMQTVKLVLADCQISKGEFKAMEKRLKTLQKELRSKKNKKEEIGKDFLIEDAETYFDNNAEVAHIMPHMGNVYHSKEVDGFTYDLVMGDKPLVENEQNRKNHTTIANKKMISETEANS